MTPPGGHGSTRPVPPPTISVVIPAYNEGARLPPFVESLTRVALQQSHPAVEFIVSDDGSKPDHIERERACVEAAQARLTEAKSPHRFVFLPAERNGGKGSAIRNGWRQSNPGAEWLAFLDADGAVNAEEFMRLALLAATSREVLVASPTRLSWRAQLEQEQLTRSRDGTLDARDRRASRG